MIKPYISVSIRLLISIVMVLFALGCKKQTTKYYIQESFKPWVLFQKESHWIYLNEKSQTLDSTYITNQPVSYFTPPAPAPIQYEEIIFSYSNSFLKDAYISSGKDVPFCILEDFFSSSHVLSARIINNTSIKVSENCWLVEKFDTLIINNNKFTNVLHTRDTNSYPKSLCIKDYYFAETIGLVKFSIKTPQIDSTWSLLRWYVIQ